MSIYGNQILQEYSGNEYDNKNFANCMKELDDIAKYYVELDKVVMANVDFIVDALKKCKKADDVKKALNNAYNNSDKTNKDLNTMWNKFNERPTFKRFKSLTKKFSVKYSDVTMEEKKKWAEVFKKYHLDIVDMGKAYDNKWIDMVNNEIDRCKKLDYQETMKAVQLIQAWYDCLYNYFYYTHNNILYVIYKLDTGFEDTLRYKLVQKIFKSDKK